MLPPDFIREITSLLGADEAAALAHALTGDGAPVSIRLNPLKPVGVLPAPAAAGVPWCETGRYLTLRPPFTYDPLLHGGAYYVQEASSMAVERAYRTLEAADAGAPPRRMLDLCAAPGGKSTLWRALLPEGALLVANEPVRQRAQVLAENLTKWGHPDVITTSAYPVDFAPLTAFFDIVATDVPCSGEGMFRKDSGAVAEWSREAVTRCADRQWQIVSDIWPALRGGGWLVYSTCTFNREENEDMVARICDELGAELVPIDFSPSRDEAAGSAVKASIAGDTTGRGLPVYHFFPHRIDGEGFFIALLRKTAEASDAFKPGKRWVKKLRETALAMNAQVPVRPTAGRLKEGRRGCKGQQGARGASAVSNWLRGHERFTIFRPDATRLSAMRRTLYDDLLYVMSLVPVLTAGIALAEERGSKLIPAHALALSADRAPEAFPTLSLTRDDALAYLRHEVLLPPADTPRGYVLVAYDGLPLGFVNHIAPRANNLYPSEWRIRNVQKTITGDSEN